MNKSQAITEAGKKAITEINDGNPDLTSRVTDNNYVEFSESANYINEYGDNAEITGYWYFKKSDVNTVDSLDLLNWDDADKYEVTD